MNVTEKRRGSTSSEPPGAAQEENLPLYQKFQLQDPRIDTDTVPPSTATPAEVRGYLASLLTKRHDLPENQVQRVVAHWTIGTGRELRVYTAQMFLDIFGGEYGWALYRDVRLELYLVQPKNFMQDGRLCEFTRSSIKWHQSTKRAVRANFWVDKYTAFAWLFACLFAIILSIFHHMNSQLMTTLMLVFSTPVGVMVLTGTVWSTMEYFSTETPPQVWIEKELQRCTRNIATSRTL